MKLRNKLILSCAALAAVATTAFSTTFAWYTANDTVKASGITGQTSQTDSTLLLISKYGKVGSWGAAVEINSSAVTLEPVAYNADDDAYYPWVPNDNDVDDTAATGGLSASDKYISFYLYFKSGSSQSLNVQIKSFTLTNTDVAALPTFSVLADGTGVTDASYSVDMFRALDVALTVEQGTEVARAADSPVVTSAGTRTAYNCDSLATAQTQSSTAGDNINVSSANAHTYYNNVKSLNPGIDDNLSHVPPVKPRLRPIVKGDFILYFSEMHIINVGNNKASFSDTPPVGYLRVKKYCGKFNL